MSAIQVPKGTQCTHYCVTYNDDDGGDGDGGANCSDSDARSLKDPMIKMPCMHAHLWKKEI